MVSSVGWTVAVADDETMSTRSPEPRAGDEKDEEAMVSEKERRGKGRYWKSAVVHVGGSALVLARELTTTTTTTNSAGPAALGTARKG